MNWRLYLAILLLIAFGWVAGWSMHPRSQPCVVPFITR